MNKETQELLAEGFAALVLAQQKLGQAHAALLDQGWQVTFCPGEDSCGPKWAFRKPGEETFFIPTLAE